MDQSKIIDRFVKIKQSTNDIQDIEDLSILLNNELYEDFIQNNSVFINRYDQLTKLTKNILIKEKNKFSIQNGQILIRDNLFKLKSPKELLLELFNSNQIIQEVFISNQESILLLNLASIFINKFELFI